MRNTIKKTVLKQIFLLLSTLSPESLIKIVSLGEKFLIRKKNVRAKTEAIKKAFKENHPATRLMMDTFSSLSKNCKEKLIENFFINAAILGNQRQRIEKKLGFSLPWFFVISPTARCNLKCKGCYAGGYSKKDELSFEEVDRILKEAKRLGIYFIIISGGEPLVWPSLFQLLKKHNDIFFQIYTNGTLITGKAAEGLAKLGNVAPAISVEGFAEETHRRRGKDTFQQILKGMENLRKNGVLFGFSATCTRHNSEEVMSDAFIDFFIKKGCRFGWYFQYVPIGRNPDVTLMSTPEQRDKLRVRIGEIRRTKPIFLGDFWNDGPWVKGCIAGGRPGGYFHINCKGEVEPCVFLQFSVDNIKGKTLLEVLQSPFFKAFRKAQPYCQNKNLLTPCALIDNPRFLREIVEKYGARPSYPGGEKVITDPEIVKFLNNYSREYRKIADPIWEKELSLKFKHWKDTVD